MFRTFLKTLALSAALTLGCAAQAADDPTLQQVYQAAESGHIGDAQNMMAQVLRDHPGSAKAHFVEAELLARQGRIAESRKELGTAQQLAPGLPFAKPASVRELEQMLAAPVSRSSYQPVRQSSFPWGGLLMIGLIVVAFMFFLRTLRAMRQPQVVVQPGYGGNFGGGYGAAPMGGGYGPMPMGGGGMGSGILGGLATGAAVGAGMVAGEALMERIIDGGHSSAASSPAVFQDNSMIDPQSYDMGGNDFGVSDGGSWDSGGGGGGDFGVGGGGDWT